MFKLIDKNDDKVFSKIVFIKNAEFFKDAVAFFDAFSLVCETEKQKLPAYCFTAKGKMCLEGVCLFVKTYAAQFSFKSACLSTSYLKILYYSIAALSGGKKTVSRDLLINEFLVYKDANEKQTNMVLDATKKAEENYAAHKKIYDKKYDEFQKNSTASVVLKIFSIMVIIMSFVLACVPMGLFYAEKLAMRSAVIYAVGTLVVGLIVEIELKIASWMTGKHAKEIEFTLLMLSKNKDNAAALLEKIQSKNSKVLLENYEYSRGLEFEILGEKLSFDEILKRAKENDQFENKKISEIVKFDLKKTGEVFDLVEKIMTIEPENVGRFENVYRELENDDYLKNNKLVKLSFLCKFAKSASLNGKDKLDFGKKQVRPYGVSVKSLLGEEFLFAGEDKNIKIAKVEDFFAGKLDKGGKQFSFRIAADIDSFEKLKLKFVKSFFAAPAKEIKDYLKEDEALSFETIAQNGLKNQIPTLISVNLDAVKTRFVSNALPEDEFSKIKSVVSAYESALEPDDLVLAGRKMLLSAATPQNIGLLGEILQCDVEDLGAGEVLCVIDGQSFKVYNFSNF